MKTEDLDNPLYTVFGDWRIDDRETDRVYRTH